MGVPSWKRREEKLDDSVCSYLPGAPRRGAGDAEKAVMVRNLANIDQYRLIIMDAKMVVEAQEAGGHYPVESSPVIQPVW